MLRPLLMWYDQPMPGIIRIMTAMGNPIIWLTSTATVVVSMLYVAWLAIKKWSDALHHPLTPLLIGYFSFLLPWALVTRVVFIYHYLPCYGFALLMLAYWLGEGWHKNRAVALIVMLVLLISSIFFIPMATGTGMSQNMVDAHIWLKSWLY